MRYQEFARVAATVLATALLAGGALAQSKPEPATMTDTAPHPAQDRASVGAVILMDEPVLAQREAMLAVRERSEIDTRAMGAGPARALRDAMTKEELKNQRALEAEQRRRGGTPN